MLLVLCSLSDWPPDAVLRGTYKWTELPVPGCRYDPSYHASDQWTPLGWNKTTSHGTGRGGKLKTDYHTTDSEMVPGLSWYLAYPDTNANEVAQWERIETLYSNPTCILRCWWAVFSPVRGWTSLDWTGPGLVQYGPRIFRTGIGPVWKFIGPVQTQSGLVLDCIAGLGLYLLKSG